MINKHGSGGEWNDDDDRDLHSSYGRLPGGNEQYEKALARLKAEQAQQAERQALEQAERQALEQAEATDGGWDRFTKHGDTCLRVFKVYSKSGRAIGWSFPCSNKATALAPGRFAEFGAVCPDCRKRLLKIIAEEKKEDKAKQAAKKLAAKKKTAKKTGVRKAQPKQ